MLIIYHRGINHRAFLCRYLEIRDQVKLLYVHQSCIKMQQWNLTLSCLWDGTNYLLYLGKQLIMMSITSKHLAFSFKFRCTDRNSYCAFYLMYLHDHIKLCANPLSYYEICKQNQAIAIMLESLFSGDNFHRKALSSMLHGIFLFFHTRSTAVLLRRLWCKSMSVLRARFRFRLHM